MDLGGRSEAEFEAGLIVELGEAAGVGEEEAEIAARVHAARCRDSRWADAAPRQFFVKERGGSRSGSAGFCNTRGQFYVEITRTTCLYDRIGTKKKTNIEYVIVIKL